MAEDFHFPRRSLADGYADALIGSSPFPQRAGLILAAPRRTGKSTFLRRDLVPALEARGGFCIYVDLWADRDADPAALTLKAVGRAADRMTGAAGRALRRMGLRRIAVAGIAVDIAGGGAGEATLPEALAAVARSADRPIALLVDEAQSALRTEAGLAAMFALKAARDALQADLGPTRFALVLTGSNRDKLSDLVSGREQPFFGAAVTEFPLLGDDYVAALIAWMNARLAADNQIDGDAARRAFDLVGRRPELLFEVLRDAALSASGAPGLAREIDDRAGAIARRLAEGYEADCDGLAPLAMALLTLVAATTGRLAPYAPETKARLKNLLGDDGNAPAPTNSQVQRALDELRDRGLIWRSARGDYALEDDGFAAWLTARADPETP